MTETTGSIYRSLAERTGGDLYLGIVGPVRTGKSTFVKRFMELLVLPKIENPYQRERARDELPQSGSGRTIMTSEPKFVPEDAVAISPDGTSSCLVRLIDSVGYIIPGALGAEENGTPRMVTTPWFPEPIPMAKAAELGTRKIMDEHCSMGIVMTTDGSIHDIPREEYVSAEHRAISDMKATGKPFLVLINSTNPAGADAVRLKEDLEQAHHVRCLCVDCLTMEEGSVRDILAALLYEFPVSQICFYFPHWMQLLPADHPIKAELFETMRNCTGDIRSLRDAETGMQPVGRCSHVQSLQLRSVDPAAGIVVFDLEPISSLFYDILSEQCGMEITDDRQLMQLLTDLSKIKQNYDKISDALHQVYATGYGIVMPTADEMRLEVPEIIRKGSNYGVKLKASAPSIHMLRADIQTEITPMVGDEKQSEDLLQYLLREYENDTEKLWESNIFGKSVFELINEGLSTKLRRMPDESREKLQRTLSRIINEGSRGLLCLILS